MLLIALVLSVCYDSLMKTTSVQTVQGVQSMSVKVPVTQVRRESNIVLARDKTASMIKERISQIFYMDMEDKREKIISLLIQLERVEDPDTFLDKNECIRSYIFNQ